MMEDGHVATKSGTDQPPESKIFQFLLHEKLHRAAVNTRPYKVHLDHLGLHVYLTSSTMAPQPAASTSAQPLPENFSRPQAKKAVDALLKHHEKVVAEREDTELISRDEYVYLVVNTKRGNTKRKMMPKRM